MRNSYIIAIVVAFVSAVLAFYMFEQMTLNMEFDVVISAPSYFVFNILKDPERLTDINFSVKNISIMRRNNDHESTEEIQYIATEDVTHVGLLDAPSILISDEDDLTVHIKSVSLYGIVRSHVRYRVDEVEGEGQVTKTVLRERCTVHMPWLLQSFINKTVTALHPQVLQNVKLLLEKNSVSSTARTEE